MTSTAPAPPRDHGIADPQPRDVIPAVVGLGVVLLPFLDPAGPGNTAAADLAFTGALTLAVLWLARDNVAVPVPYVAGVAVMMLGGLVAAMASGAPASVGLVLVQDLLLLMTAWLLALGAERTAIVRAATVAWCRVAACYAPVAVLAYLLGIQVLTGVNADEGARAAYTFGDPNMAGSWLVMSFLLVAACGRPVQPVVRGLVLVLLAVATVSTGSNGALLTLAVGCVVAGVARQLALRGVLVAVLTAALLGTALTIGAVGVAQRVSLDDVRERASASVPLLRDSVGRSNNSTSQRAELIREGTQLWLRGHPLGVGPARTRATLEDEQSPYPKEAHNDYLASLVERGPLGLLGLALLGAAVAWRCARLLLHGVLASDLRGMVPRPWWFLAVAPVAALSASFYEVLHFRHLWVWLGLLAALTTLVNADREETPR